MRFVLLLASSLWASAALAQTPGSCAVGTAQATLDESDVQASLFNTGGLFFGGSATSGDGYLVPKASGNSTVFAASLWIGGKVGGEVRASHSRYGFRQMWPGPLDDGATLPNASDCSAYDRIWVVSVFDLAEYEANAVASPDLAEWPVGLGAPTVGANGQPVAVTSREQTIDLAAGERPVVSGTQMAFWVMNDVGNVHARNTRPPIVPDTEPLGVEVAVTASSITSQDDAFHQGTFYRYTVTNRNTRPITDAYIGFWADAELGDAGDDYVGVDTTRGMAFVYNSDDEDSEYGPAPPAAGFDLLSGLGSAPLSPKAFPIGEVGSAEAAYNQLQGLWGDGTPITMQGMGYQTDGPVTTWGFPGDPVAGAFWSEVNNDGEGTASNTADRRFMVVAPGFDLAPGASRTVELAVLFGQGTDRFDSITELRAASDRVQAAYDNGTLFAPQVTEPLATPQANQPAGTTVQRDAELSFEWTPVGGADQYRIELSRSPDFTSVQAVTQTGAIGLVTISKALIGTRTAPIYWRIRAESRTQRSLYSPTQSFMYYRYVPGTLTLANGAPAVVEVVGPGGTDPCGPTVTDPVGCDEVDGRFVLGVPNSTGTFEVGARYTSYAFLSERARQPDHDFEIRFTGSSYAHATTQWFDPESGSTTRVERFTKVPFQLWDLGPTSPTGLNDPTDDVRLIPILTDSGSLTGNACEFTYDTRDLGGSQPLPRVTMKIEGFYPRSTYRAFADVVSPRVEGSPAKCVPATMEAFNESEYLSGAPLRDLYFRDTTPGRDGTTADLNGAVIRMYTNTPFVEGFEDPQLDDSAVGAPYPNPASRLVRIPYRLGAAGDIELGIYDVLGREVVRLREGRQPKGDLEEILNARELAPGLYIVRLRAGGVIRSARLTVVR